jgi:GGDEF domain-containing protein
MTSARPYRPALTKAEAVEELLDKAGSQFHPIVARAFAAVIRDEALYDHVSAEELASLRRAFSRVAVAPATGSFNAEPRLLAMVALVATLATFGVGRAPLTLGVGLAGLTTALLAYWVAVDLRLRLRRRQAMAAVDHGLPLGRVVAAAGFEGWVTSIGSALDQAYDSTASAGELREVQSWLRLGAPAREKQLSTGVWVVRSSSPRDGRHVVLGLARRARVYEVNLAEWLADTMQAAAAPEPAPVAQRRVDGTRAVARIDLRAFDRLRRGAGQLVAERVVEETGRRLREALRASDAVIRLGDDVFAVSLVLEEDALEVVERRLRATIVDVPVPQRLDPLDPEVVIATSAEARHQPELAAIEEALLPAVVA